MRAMTELKMERKLRYAMVGGARGSFIGPIHRMAIRMDDLADLAAGCFSRDAAMNAEVAVALGVDKDRVYADWRELIAAEKGRIDFLAVCTPNDSHYAIAKAALEAGIDVMCEKPLSITLEEAAELERLARRRRRVLGIPFTYSGFPMVKLARELVAKGELGKIDKVVLEYSQGSFRKIDFSKPLDKRNSWKMDPRRSGRSCVVADIGVHGFHLIEYVTGLTVKKLLADLSSFAPGNRLDDDASILMRLSGGAKVSMTVSKVATGEENGVRLRVYGDKASLYWNQEAPNYLTVKYPFAPDRTYKRNAPYVGGLSAGAARASRIPAGHHEGFIEAVANIYDEFCLAVRDRKTHDYPGAREGVRAMRFVDAALASHNDGNVWKRV
jgi:predicted dehydrogenase